MSRASKTVLWLAVIPLLALSAYVHMRTGNAGDKNWLMLATRMWLEGKRLYVDIIDVDPPFIFWVYALPEYLALKSGGNDAYLLAVVGMACVVGSVALCLKLMRQYAPWADDESKPLQFSLLLGFAFFFYAGNNYFFDREHIFLVLTFPYVLRFMPSLSRLSVSRPVEIAVGLFAGIGFCAKPHTLILLAAVNLAYLLRERSPAILRSMENLLIYAVGIAYLVCVWLFAPQYIMTIIPMAMATYSGYRGSGLESLVAAFMIYGVTLADFRPRHKTPYRRDVYYLIIVCAAHLLYALTNNGWGYTYYPLLAMGMILTGWVWWEQHWLKREHAARGLPVKPFIFGQRACAINLACNAAFALLGLVLFFSASSCDKNAECKKYTLLMREMKEQNVTSFGVMSDEYHKWAQIARASGARWATRFNNLWMLPAFAMHDQSFAERNQWILDYVDAAFAEDLDRNRPQVIFVEKGTKLALPDMFAHSAAFKGAWAHYGLLHTLDLCSDAPKGAIAMQDCSYNVYKRNY